MLQYLIILLDKASVSYCHYETLSDSLNDEGLMPLDTLQAGIVFAMKENLNIQFVYPERALPEAYTKVIESIDHTKIKPETQPEEADVLVLKDWKTRIPEQVEGSICVIHASRKELTEYIEMIRELFSKVQRLNLVLTDVESFKDEDVEDYQKLLHKLADMLIEQFKVGRVVQLNLLSDRLQLNNMNNCGAGDTTITLAPNGYFYLCPAFYYNAPEQDVGSLATGLAIKNRQLLRLEYAPICRHCDAYQCKRCIWMNCRLTLDANTPSHQQCVVAHVERNASQDLYMKLEELGIFLKDTHPIKEINYLDPFINYKQWK